MRSAYTKETSASAHTESRSTGMEAMGHAKLALVALSIKQA